LVLFALLVASRVAFDYPVWGVYAIRDTTAAIEAFILLVGYRAIARDGIDYWISRCRYLAVAVLVYGAVYPFLGDVKAPNVGLQRQADGASGRNSPDLERFGPLEEEFPYT